MACSSCESLLDRYVDGDLDRRQAAWVARHLDGCPSCERLHRRLRTVDALLETTRPAELAPDFTFDVMGRIRELPAPAIVARPWWILLGIYLLAGWAALGVALLELRTGAAANAGSALHAIKNALGAVGSVAHSLSTVTPFAVSAVVLMLTIDVLLFAILAVYYRKLVPRLAAHLAAAGIR
ncbi:MAG TPA: zf-HC2 domain-containing protein [Candidatus Tumulicola sp.]